MSKFIRFSTILGSVIFLAIVFPVRQEYNNTNFEEVLKFIVSVIAVLFPVYIAVLTLFFTFSEPKLKKIINSAKPILDDIDAKLVDMRFSYLFSSYVMGLALVLTTIVYFFLMVNNFAKEAKSIPLIIIYPSIYFTCISVIEAFVGVAQIAGIINIDTDKLCTLIEKTEERINSGGVTNTLCVEKITVNNLVVNQIEKRDLSTAPFSSPPKTNSNVKKRPKN